MTANSKSAVLAGARMKARKGNPAAAGRKRVGFGLKFVAIGAVLLIWQLLSVSPIVNSDSLPGPVTVFSALVGLWGTSGYWTAIGTTLQVWAIGLALCALIGIPAGLLIGVSVRATQSTRWVIDFFRTIPTIALLPLVLLLFGATSRMEITMIVLAAVWPLLIQSMYAAKQVEPLLKWVVRVFRISTLDRLRFLWAPSVTLLVSTGMRLAATMALLMTIAAEYIGGAPGLGLELSHMEQAFKRPEVFAYAITAGLIGLSINSALVLFQRRVLWWHPIIRGERSE
ncbi:ABC transporter permease subunit [Pseudarthrobacter oxydans]|uniref:ABC transporter permease n=1 Tax=Pseudarthrobacter oxydans TaxID=1671 RepID=UPI003D279A30